MPLGGTNTISTVSDDSNASRRLALLLEEEALWDELTRFKDSHLGSLAAQDEPELRRLRVAWTQAAQALFHFDNPA